MPQDIYKKRIFIKLGISSVIILLLIFLVIYPTYIKNNGLTNTIQKLEQTQKQHTISIDIIEKIQKSEDQLATEQNIISSVFVDPDRVFDFIKQLEEIRKKTGVSQKIETSTVITPTIDPKTHKEVTEPVDEDEILKITLQGTYSSLMEYLIRLENSGVYTQIENFNFIKKSSDDSLKPYELIISLKFYYL